MAKSVPAPKAEAASPTPKVAGHRGRPPAREAKADDAKHRRPDDQPSWLGGRPRDAGGGRRAAGAARRAGPHGCDLQGCRGVSAEGSGRQHATDALQPADVVPPATRAGVGLGASLASPGVSRPRSGRPWAAWFTAGRTQAAALRDLVRGVRPGRRLPPPARRGRRRRTGRG